MIRHECTYHLNFELKSFKEYHNGVLIKEENYNNKGQLHGLHLEWHDNVRVEEVYYNGIQNSCRIWLSSGDEVIKKENKNMYALMLGLK